MGRSRSRSMSRSRGRSRSRHLVCQPRQVLGTVKGTVGVKSGVRTNE